MIKNLIMYPDYPNDIYLGKLNAETAMRNAVRAADCLYSFLKNNFTASVLWLGFENACTPFYHVTE